MTVLPYVLTAFLLLLFVFADAAVVAKSPVKDPEEAVIKNDDVVRLKGGLVECPCSPTTRGFRKDEVLPEGRAALMELVSSLGAIGNNNTIAASEATALYDECAATHGHEACVNWDASSIFMGDASLCMSDRATGRNVVKKDAMSVHTVGACDLRDDMKSPASSLRQIDNVNEPDSRVIPVPTEFPEVDSIFEGCVAIEHLPGVGLQHAAHLRRRVLCWNRFCATPNHAIIVDGKWTSMKAMCSAGGEWNCTRTIKRVNNLSVAYNTRYRYNRRIVITPYDSRFPRALMWLAQIIEDLIYFVGVATVFAFISAIAAVFATALVFIFDPQNDKGFIKS